MEKKKNKILFIQTEDWFFKSHFVPLAKALLDDAKYESVIVTTVGKEREFLEKLGLKVIHLDFKRSSFNIFLALKLVIQLVIIYFKERPNIIHLIALKPMLVGGLASIFYPKAANIFHLTGLGYLADGKSKLAEVRRKIFFGIIAILLRIKKSWLITENPDDKEYLIKYGMSKKVRYSLFGGAGVDVDYYSLEFKNEIKNLKAAYVGRMIQSKGVDVLVKAKQELNKRGIKLDIELFGAPDLANPNSYDLETLEKWNKVEGINWHGKISDVREVWKKCEIAIMPTRTREGMPKAMLEAAACSRALVVSDVPGCRHFVEDGIEGFIVKPDDEIALADALEKLATNKKLRMKMGKAARKKILSNFSEEHIKKAIIQIYNELIL